MRALAYSALKTSGRGATPDLTLVIPAYNEAARLPATLSAIQQELDQWWLDYEVLVVDDGSHDRTSEVTDQFDDRFSCLRLRKNAGKGAAVRAGMLHASGRVVAFTDADLPFDLQALREAATWISADQCDVVCGDRTTDVASETPTVSTSLMRKLSGFCFRQLVSWIAAAPLRDTQCGLKVFSHSAAQEVFQNVESTGFAFDVEVICQASRLGFRLSTIPVHLINTLGSTISLRKHSLPMLKELIAIRKRLRSTPIPSRRHWESDVMQPRRAA